MKHTEEKKTDSLKANDKEVKERLRDEIKKEKFRPFWTWYLYLVCNILVILGAAISWILWMYGNKESIYIPVLVCNLVSLGGFVAFMIFEAKDVKLKIFHTKKKWIYFIIAGACIYAALVIMTSLIVAFPITEINKVPVNLVCSFAISAGISLVDIGLYRYGRFHIDKDIFARKHGVMVKEQIEAEKVHAADREKVEKMSDEEFKKYRDKIDTTPDHEKIGREATSGLSHEKFDD